MAVPPVLTVSPPQAAAAAAPLSLNLPIPRAPCIARSVPVAGMQIFIDNLWTDSPEMCRTIFTDLFPRGVNRLGASKAEEDEFIGKFFDQYTVHVQGARFLKEVLYCIAVYNDGRIIQAAQKFEQDNRSLFQDYRMVTAMLEYTDTRKFFGEDDIKPYSNDQHLLRRVMRAVQHKVRFIRTLEQEHQEQQQHQLQQQGGPNFRPPDFGKVNQKLLSSDDLISPHSIAPLGRAESVMPSNHVGITDTALPRSLSSDGVLMPKPIPSIAGQGDLHQDPVALRKTRSMGPNLTLPHPASDRRFTEPQIMPSGLYKAQLNAKEVQRTASAATQTPRGQNASVGGLRGGNAGAENPVPTHPIDTANRSNEPSSARATGPPDRRGSIGSRGSRGSNRARGRGRGTYNGPSPVHGPRGRGQENRPFNSQSQPGHPWRRQYAQEPARHFEPRVFSDGSHIPRVDSFQPGMMNMTMIGPHFPGPAYFGPVPGFIPGPRFGFQPHVADHTFIRQGAFPQGSMLSPHAGPQLVPSDKVAVLGLPSGFSDEALRRLIAGVSPNNSLISVDIRPKVAFVRFADSAAAAALIRDDPFCVVHESRIRFARPHSQGSHVNPRAEPPMLQAPPFPSPIPSIADVPKPVVTRRDTNPFPEDDPTFGARSEVVIKNAAGEKLSHATLGDARLIKPNTDGQTPASEKAAPKPDLGMAAAPADVKSQQPSEDVRSQKTLSKKKPKKKDGENRLNARSGNTEVLSKASDTAAKQCDEHDSVAVVGSPSQQLKVSHEAATTMYCEWSADGSIIESAAQSKIADIPAGLPKEPADLGSAHVSVLSPKIPASESLTLPKRTKLEYLPEEPACTEGASMEESHTDHVRVRADRHDEDKSEAASFQHGAATSQAAAHSQLDAVQSRTLQKSGSASSLSLTLPKRATAPRSSSAQEKRYITPFRSITGQSSTDSPTGMDDVDDSFRTAAENPEDDDVGVHLGASDLHATEDGRHQSPLEQNFGSIEPVLKLAGSTQTPSTINTTRTADRAAENCEAEISDAQNQLQVQREEDLTRVTPTSPVSSTVQAQEAPVLVKKATRIPSEVSSTTELAVSKPTDPGRKVIEHKRGNRVASLKSGPKHTESLSPYARQAKIQKSDKKTKQKPKTKPKGGISAQDHEGSPQPQTPQLGKLPQQDAKLAQIHGDEKEPYQPAAREDSARNDPKLATHKSKMKSLKEIPALIKGALKGTSTPKPPPGDPATVETATPEHSPTKKMPQSSNNTPGPGAPPPSGSPAGAKEHLARPSSVPAAALADTLVNLNLDPKLQNEAPGVTTGFDGAFSDKDQTSAISDKAKGKLPAEGHSNLISKSQSHLIEAPQDPNVRRKQRNKNKNKNRKLAAKAARDKDEVASNEEPSPEPIQVLTPDSERQDVGKGAQQHKDNHDEGRDDSERSSGASTPDTCVHEERQIPQVQHYINAYYELKCPMDIHGGAEAGARQPLPQHEPSWSKAVRSFVPQPSVLERRMHQVQEEVTKAVAGMEPASERFRRKRERLHSRRPSTDGFSL